jgi:hypothetical protein
MYKNMNRPITPIQTPKPTGKKLKTIREVLPNSELVKYLFDDEDAKFYYVHVNLD